MPFQMQKTRLNLDTRHRIGNHLINVAAEVGVAVVGVLVVVVVLSGRVMNRLKSARTSKIARERRNNQTKSRTAKLLKSK